MGLLESGYRIKQGQQITHIKIRYYLTSFRACLYGHLSLFANSPMLAMALSRSKWEKLKIIV